MNICVVTPYFHTPPAWLAQCHASVRAQTVAAHHILVCDGSPPATVQEFNGTHIVLQRNYADYGNTPRFIGCYQAIAQGADAIAFLDSDNWYYPDHLQALAQAMTLLGWDAGCSARMLHRLDGSVLGRCPHVSGMERIDTSGLMVFRPAFAHLVAWVLQPQQIAAEVDQTLWTFLHQRGVSGGFLDRPSLAYRTRHAVHYLAAGETPPEGTIRRTDLHGAHYQ